MYLIVKDMLTDLRSLLLILGAGAALTALVAPSASNSVISPGQPVVCVVARPVSVSRLVCKRTTPADTAARPVAGTLAAARPSSYLLGATSALR